MFLYEEIRGSFYYNLVFTRPDLWQNANGPRAKQDESHDGTAKSVEIEDAQAWGAKSAVSTTYWDNLMTTTFAQEDGYHDFDASMTEGLRPSQSSCQPLRCTPINWYDICSQFESFQCNSMLLKIDYFHTPL